MAIVYPAYVGRGVWPHCAVNIGVHMAAVIVLKDNYLGL